MLNMTFDIWSAIFNVILIVAVLLTRRYNQIQAQSLVGALLANTAVNSFEVLAYVFRGDVSTLGWWMVRISNFTVFLCNHLLLLFGAMFILQTMERDGYTASITFKRVFVTIVATGITLLVLSRIFGFYYAFDEQNHYYRIRGYWLLVGLIWMASFALFVLTIKNWRRFTRAERIAFIMLEVLPLAVMPLQLLMYGISLTAFANTLSLTMLFMSYELECSHQIISNERKILNEVIAALAEAVDAKDTYTRGHSGRVAEYARLIAQRMDLDQEDVDRIYRMAMLHDVGKIGVPDAVLNKPGKLTDEEFALIKSHAARGGDILSKVESMPELSSGARWHHERFDGRGYPDGLTQDQIPFEARIICVADCYDAMTSDRVYRDHLPQDVVRNEIKKNAGTQFDPRIANVMLQIIDEDTEYRLHE